VPTVQDLQTSPTTANSAQVTVWDLARAYPAARGIPVPQKMYKPHTQSDRRRYVEEVELEPPIMFYLQGPGDCGIPLRDALTGKYIRLTGRDDPMFRERGPSVSIRLKVASLPLTSKLMADRVEFSSGRDTEIGLDKYDLRQSPGSLISDPHFRFQRRTSGVLLAPLPAQSLRRTSLELLRGS
jgi:hypothetical protein